MMTLEEYKANMEQEDWAPGWEAIDGVFEALYPGQRPRHYATNMVNRAIFGGDAYLDGFSFYHSDRGYLHLVTYGMSELYAKESAFGGQWSKWGYEMTMKLADGRAEENLWAVSVLDNLARYTFRTERFFEPYQYIKGGEPICQGSDSRITSLLVVSDTQAQGVDTVHGRLDFLQLVGITTRELKAVLDQTVTPQELIRRMAEDSPDLVLDLERTREYV